MYLVVVRTVTCYIQIQSSYCSNLTLRNGSCRVLLLAALKLATLLTDSQRMCVLFIIEFRLRRKSLEMMKKESCSRMQIRRRRQT